MEDREINLTPIKYREGMTMEELVNEINEKNEDAIMGLKSHMKYQTDLVLGEIKKMDEKWDKRFDHLEKLIREQKR